MLQRLATIAALLLPLLLAVGCAGPQPLPRAPRLLIIGGGSLDHTSIRPEFLRNTCGLPGQRGTVLVLPTASGDPTASSLAATTALERIATHHDIGILLITQDDPQRADDPDAARQLREADAVWFTGGDQSRITSAFRPATDAKAGDTSRADAALREMLAAGGMVAGTSAGAAMMSHPMIAGGQSDNALLFGAGDAGVQLAPGMGLFTFGLIDQHFLQRGRMGRLIAALEVSDTRFGFGIDEGAAALVILGDDHQLVALGPDTALIVDIANAQQGTTGHRNNIRVSLLGTGDQWDLLLHQPTPHFSKINRDQIVGPLEGPPHDPMRNAWESGAIRDAIHTLAADTDTPTRALVSEYFVLMFTADDQTRFYVERGNRANLFAANIKLDIRRRSGLDGLGD